MNWNPKFMDRLLGQPLHRVVYLSHARQDYDLPTLQRYCGAFAAANGVLGVTGLLIYASGHFMQILEGETPVMQSLMRRIGMDCRHCGLRMLLEEDARSRLFPHNPMSLLDLEAPAPLAPGDCEALRGFVEHAVHARHAPTAQVLQLMPVMLRRFQPQAA